MAVWILTAIVVIETIAILIIMAYNNDKTVPIEKYWDIEKNYRDQRDKCREQLNSHAAHCSLMADAAVKRERRMRLLENELPSTSELFKKLAIKLAEEHNVAESSITDVRLENGDVTFTGGKYGHRLGTES